MSQPEQIISLKDVYHEVVRLNGRMEAMAQWQLQAVDLDKDHEARIRALERWRYALPASFILALGSSGAAAIAIFVHH